MRSSRPRIYLAGPDVFFPDRDEIFGGLKAQCAAMGLEGISPMDDADAAAAHAGHDERAQAIFEHNIRLIRDADGVIAHLTSFRGQEPDSGTVFEVGFAVALGKPVAGYGVPDGTYAERVQAAIACQRDQAGEVCEVASGRVVEGLGQPLNLMLSRSVTIAATSAEALRVLAKLLLVSPAAPAG